MEEPKLVIVFAVLSFAVYFGIGYGAAALFRCSSSWRLGIGVALPVILFLGCWVYDLNDKPHGIIYIPARAIWTLPGMFLLRLFIPR